MRKGQTYTLLFGHRPIVKDDSLKQLLLAAIEVYQYERNCWVIFPTGIKLSVRAAMILA